MKWGRAAVLVAIAALAAGPATAGPLTVRVGESWLFSISNGQPVKAKRVAAGARPARGQIKASVNAMAGTTMTLTNNSSFSYTFIAELIGAPPAKANKRTCTLPPTRPTIEYWPVKSAGVRIGSFKVSHDTGNCPD